MADEPRQVVGVQPEAGAHHPAHGDPNRRIGQALVGTVGEPQQQAAGALGQDRAPVVVQAPCGLGNAIGAVLHGGTLETLALAGER
jgi:hypothetical protein